MLPDPPSAGSDQEMPVRENPCPAGCDARTATIGLRGKSGCALTLSSCPDCDHRWWRRDGEIVPLTEVLGELSPAVLRRAS